MTRENLDDLKLYVDLIEYLTDKREVYLSIRQRPDIENKDAFDGDIDSYTTFIKFIQRKLKEEIESL